jgi:hypothetical protein
MTKLNQIIAVVNGKKTETQKAITEIYRKLGVPELFSGLSRVYKPKNDEDETLPSENKKVQLTVVNVVDEFKEHMSGLLDVVATQEYANCEAKADVVVDGKLLLSQVPVSYLLFLEKQLVDLGTFVSKLPTLDISEDWEFDDNKNMYASKTSMSNRTQKVPKHKVLYEATAQHPAQIEKWTEDVAVGTWSTTKFSGAVSVKERKETLDKVKKLQDAVKFAREEANSLEVKSQSIAKPLFNYLFD